MTADATCAGCGGRMILVEPDQTTHPTCDNSPEARQIRAEHAAAKRARIGKLFGQRSTVDAHPTAHADAVAIIQAAALRLPEFSANNLRAVDASWERIHGPVRGAAFTTAVKRRWIEHVGYEPSTSEATHGHDVKTYRSLIHNTNTRRTA